MTTSGLASLSGDSSIAMLFRQRRDDLNTLASAVQSGNITDAQTALKSYQQDNDKITSSSSSTHHHRNPKLQADFSALTTAIQSGSIADAQAALKAYEEDRHPPEHEQGSEPPAPAAGDAKSSFVNDFVTLVKDALSGDTAAAQKDATALAKDIVELFRESAAKAGVSLDTADAASGSDAASTSSPSASAQTSTSVASLDDKTDSSDSDQDASPAKAINDIIAAYDLASFDETPKSQSPLTV